MQWIYPRENFIPYTYIYIYTYIFYDKAQDRWTVILPPSLLHLPCAEHFGFFDFVRLVVWVWTVNKTPTEIVTSEILFVSLPSRFAKGTFVFHHHRKNELSVPMGAMIYLIYIISKWLLFSMRRSVAMTQTKSNHEWLIVVAPPSMIQSMFLWWKLDGVPF